MSSMDSGAKPVTMLFRQVQNALRRATDQELASIGVTAAQASVLTELASGPPRTNAELARMIFVTPQTMGEVLLRMEDLGLIRRKAPPEGGRAMPAELSENGRRKLLEVHLAMQGVERLMLAVVAEEEGGRLRQLLEGCLAALGRKGGGQAG